MAITEEGQGAAGEQRAAAVGSGSYEGDILSELNLDEQPQQAQGQRAGEPDDVVLEKLRGMDPSKLPTDLRQKLELPLLQNYTARMTEKDREIQQLRWQLEQRQGQKDQRAEEEEELKSRAMSGDAEALAEYVSRQAEAKINPLVEQSARQQAINTAYGLGPEVKRFEAQISAELMSDPVSAELARMANYKYAPFVLHYHALRHQAAVNEAEKKAYAREAVLQYQRKIRGLPPVTTQAGGAVRSVPVEPASSMRDSARQFFISQGLNPEDVGF